MDFGFRWGAAKPTTSPKSEIRNPKSFHDRATVLAGAVLLAAHELGDGTLDLDANVLEFKTRLVELVVAVFAEPHQFVHLAGVAVALDDDTDRVGWALRRGSIGLSVLVVVLVVSRIES